MYDCVTIGDIALDRFLKLSDVTIRPSDTNPGNFDMVLELGQKLPVQEVIESVGGNACNVAVGMHNLGQSVAIIANLGTDQDSETILSHLHGQGITTDYITRTTDEHTNSSTILSIKGERTVLSYHAERTYKLPPIPRTNCIYLTSMGIGCDSLVQQVLSHVKEHHLSLAFNPGSYFMKHKIGMIQKILPQVKILFVNKEEAQAITGKRDEEHIPHLIQELLTKGVEIVALTDGVHGAYVGVEHSLQYLRPLPQSGPIAETTGAGDAFASGFMSAYLSGKSLDVALQYGIANSGSVIRETGSTHGLLSDVAMDRILKDIDLTVETV